MSPQAWSAIIAGLAVAGQVVNVILNLKLRNAILESEQRTLDHVEEKLKDYQLVKVCDAAMAPLIPRGRRAA